MSVLTPIEEHLSLNYVDIKKDAGTGIINKINTAGKAIFTAGPPTNSHNLATIKKVIETNYAKLFTIMSSGNSKDIKITYNINNFFIDAGWSKHDIEKYIDTDSIKICTTPAMYSDPGSRDKGDVFIPINNKDLPFDLRQYGINAKVSYTSANQTTNPDTISIKIVEPDPKKYKYDDIDCDLNFKHVITKFNNNIHNTTLQYFKGNTVKNNYISKNDAAFKDINRFVLCKELGDTMQAICLKYIIDKDTTKTYTKENSALLTNDHVLAARCLTLPIPYILLSNGKIIYRSPGDPILVNTNFFLTFINNALEINKEQQKILEDKYKLGSSIPVKNSGTRNVTEDIRNKFDEIIGNIKNTNKILVKLSLNYKNIYFKNNDNLDDNLIILDDNLRKFKIFIEALTVQPITSKSKQLFDRNLKNIHEEQVHINSNLTNPVPAITTFGAIKTFFKNIFLNQTPTTPTTPAIPATSMTINLFMKHILEGSELYNFYIGNITTECCWLVLPSKQNLGEFIIAKSNIGGNKSKKRAKGLLGIIKSTLTRKTRVIKITPRANMSLQASTPPQKTRTKRKRETSSIKTSSIKPKFNLESLLDESNSVKLYQEQNYTDNEAVIYIYHKIYSFIYINPYYYDYLLDNFEEFKKLVQLIITDYDLENNDTLQGIYKFVTDKNELMKDIEDQIKVMEEHIFIDKYLKKGKFEDIDNIEPIVTRQFQLQIEEILRNRNNAQLVRFEFPKKKPESEPIPIPRVRTRSILPRLSTSKRGRKTRRRAKSL